MALDIAAVADALALETFVLNGALWSVPIAIAYAAKHPERLSHLFLFGGFARGEEMEEIPRVRTLFSMLDQGDWEQFTDTMHLNWFGWHLPEVAQRVAAVERESRTVEQAVAFYGAVRRYDVTALLPKVTTPTLVMHPRGATFPTLDMARKLAAGIPDARLKVLESETFWSDEIEPQFLDALDDFIGDGDRPEAETVQPEARRVVRRGPGFATVLFTDVVGHTEMMRRLGDDRGRAVLREHEQITRKLLEAHDGTEVKTMGDGFMASFGSATRALECAIAIQTAFAERNESAEEPIKVRIGLNAGEPIAEDDPGGRGDLFGTAVNMAARIAAKAEAGEILTSNVVRELVAGKEFLFNDRGDTELRGFEDPVRVYEVRWHD
jgi:class 3 adenylate cyclase